jgi:hypothetical protein
MQQLVLELKSFVRKALGIPDPWKRLREFQRRIHPKTWSGQEAVLRWVKARAADPARGDAEESDDPVVLRGRELRTRVLAEFRGRFAARTDHRVLLLLYSFGVAPAAYSLFRNLADALEWLGVPAAWWEPKQDLGPVLDAFRPTVFLANDPADYAPERYLDYIDWRVLDDYRKANALKLGLVAGPYPQAPAVLDARLRHARRLGVDFYFSFQAPAFVAEFHAPYRRHGFHVCSLEFGANPLVYYPVPAPRDLPFVFLGSAHYEKLDQYRLYFGDLLASVPGFIAGPGWRGTAREQLPEPWHRFLYARAKVGLNLHVPFQLEAATELNERAYNLAASGTPQLTDAPKLLPERFTPDSLYVASTPREYRELFGRILARPEEARERALRALEQALTRHTVFHRADAFLHDLTDNVLGG